MDYLRACSIFTFNIFILCLCLLAFNEPSIWPYHLQISLKSNFRIVAIKTSKVLAIKYYLLCMNFVVKKEASVICFGNGTESNVRMCVIL